MRCHAAARRVRGSSSSRAVPPCDDAGSVDAAGRCNRAACRADHARVPRASEITFGEFRQRVRRHSPSTLLPALAARASQLIERRTWFEGQRVENPWALAAAARASLLHGNEWRPPATTADVLAACARRSRRCASCAPVRSRINAPSGSAPHMSSCRDPRGSAGRRPAQGLRRTFLGAVECGSVSMSLWCPLDRSGAGGVDQRRTTALLPAAGVGVGDLLALDRDLPGPAWGAERGTDMKRWLAVAAAAVALGVTAWVAPASASAAPYCGIPWGRCRSRRARDALARHDHAVLVTGRQGFVPVGDPAAPR